MKHSSLGGNSYVVIFVDDCTRFKVVKFVKKKSDTTAALLSLIADYITPQKLSIECVRTDIGGKFEGEFQRKLDRRSITHEHTPPDTPQYNGVAERALGLPHWHGSVLLVRTRNIVESQVVQWVDGPKKTGGDGTGSDDSGMKSAEDGTFVERGTP